MDQTLPLLPNPRQTGLVNVCINACERMNGTRLRNAQEFKREQLDEENNIYLKESQWQHEFYGALISLVGAQCATLSDGGKEVDCRGEIDFYVNGVLRWGIELMRQ